MQNFFYSIANNAQSFLAIFVFIFGIVCRFIIFVKCKEKGYKAIIPFYSDYIRFKLFYSKKMYFVNLLIGLVSIGMFIYITSVIWNLAFTYKTFDAMALTQLLYQLPNANVINIISQSILLLIFISYVIDCICRFWTLKSFNKSFWWILVYIFIPIVCQIILAYDKSSIYQGNVYLEHKINNSNKININSNN